MSKAWTKIILWGNLQGTGEVFFKCILFQFTHACMYRYIQVLLHLVFVSTFWGRKIHSLILTYISVTQFLTLTVWWAIPVIWLPVVCCCISMSVRMGHTLPEIVLMVIFGVFLWTLIEYTLHRFLFHIKTKSYWLVLSLGYIFSLFLMEIMKLYIIGLYFSALK